VAGFIRLAETPGVEGDTFNLGSGTEVSIADLAQMIVDLLGKPISIEVDPARMRPPMSEVQRLLADISLARERLDWEPRVNLREGLGRTIDWIAENLHLYRTDRYQV
jgi:nucleoside-diphosphate-sugar epimerase